MEDKKKLIFVPTEEDKKICSDCVHEVINVVEKHCNNNLAMRVFIFNILIDSFKDSFNVDLRYESTTNYSKSD